MHAREYLQELIDKQVCSNEHYIVASLHRNPKLFWSYVNNKLKDKKNALKLVKVNDSCEEQFIV